MVDLAVLANGGAWSYRSFPTLMFPWFTEQVTSVGYLISLNPQADNIFSCTFLLTLLQFPFLMVLRYLRTCPWEPVLPNPTPLSLQGLGETHLWLKWQLEVMLQLLINELSPDCLKRKSHPVFWVGCISKSSMSQQCTGAGMLRGRAGSGSSQKNPP